MGIWGDTKKAMSSRQAWFVISAQKGLHRSLTANESAVVKEYFARADARKSRVLWLCGSVGAGLTYRRAMQQGWTFSTMFRPVPTSLTYRSKSWSGFRIEPLVGERAALHIRAFSAFFLYGALIGTSIAPLLVPHPSTMAQGQVFTNLVSIVVSGQREARDTSRTFSQQQQHKMPPQVADQLRPEQSEQLDQLKQSEQPEPSDGYGQDLGEPKAAEFSPPAYTSKWDQIRAQSKASKQTTDARDQAQRDFDKGLERERKGGDF